MSYNTLFIYKPWLHQVNAVDNEHGDEGEQELPEPDGDAYKTMKEQP
jgi:hypothetical protein